MKRVPNLSLEQIYPSAERDLNLNTCHDPDCGNFGEAADLILARPIGRGAPSRLAAMRSNTAMVGLGQYKLSSRSDPSARRVSSVFEYEDDPHTWLDDRLMECQFKGYRGSCGVNFGLLSNEHLVAEVERLRSHNGIFDGPVCGACGRAYLEAPTEFSLNGA